jgi:hypothetical protein
MSNKLIPRLMVVALVLMLFAGSALPAAGGW